MPSLLDPLPEEGQQLVEFVGRTYAQFGGWPVWQFVAQQMWEKHDVDAEAALRDLPRWPWGSGAGYRAIRTVPASAGGATPDADARAVLTIYGLFHTPDAGNHPLIDVFLKAIEIGASKQSNVTLSPIKTTPIIVSGTDLANMASHRASTVLSAATLGLLLSGEPATTGSGGAEREEWDWDLTSYPPLRKFTSPDAVGYLTKLESLLAQKMPRPFVKVAPEALPRALDHLSVAWKALTGEHRLFYPRSLASTTNLVEPVASGDQLTARLGTLADIFDLFMRGPDEKKSKTLTLFREELMRCLTDDGARERARDAVGRLLDINEIRNGRLHTDATTWAACLGRAGHHASNTPDQQWERVRAAAVEALYTIIETLQQHIL